MNPRIQSAIAATTLIGMTMSTSASAQLVSLEYRVQSATAIDIGTLGGNESEARDVSDNAVIVGWAKTTSDRKHAFEYVGGYMVDIGDGFVNAESTAEGVNNNAEIVGYYYDFDYSFIRPFYWSPGTGMTPLGQTLFPGKSYADGYTLTPKAINDSGRIVGRGDAICCGHPATDPPYDNCHVDIPVKWKDPNSEPERMFCPTDTYPSLGAHDVNNSNEIAGSYQGGNFYGYVWKAGTLTLVPRTLGNYELYIYGINESGRVVGASEGSDNHAIYWDRVSDYSTDLGVLPGGDSSEAFEINDSNFVGGWSNRVPAGMVASTYLVSRAFIWHADFGMYELPIPPGYSTSTNCVANSINNRVPTTGLIILAGYCTSSVSKHAVRWNVTANRVGIPVVVQ